MSVSRSQEIHSALNVGVGQRGRAKMVAGGKKGTASPVDVGLEFKVSCRSIMELLYTDI